MNCIVNIISTCCHLLPSVVICCHAWSFVGHFLCLENAICVPKSQNRAQIVRSFHRARQRRKSAPVFMPSYRRDRHDDRCACVPPRAARGHAARAPRGPHKLHVLDLVLPIAVLVASASIGYNTTQETQGHARLLTVGQRGATLMLHLYTSTSIRDSILRASAGREGGSGARLACIDDRNVAVSVRRRKCSSG